MTLFSELDKTDTSDDLLDYITNIVHETNLNGGFTVPVCYKKGVAKDNSNDESNTQIATGSISIHPVNIVHTNIDDAQ